MYWILAQAEAANQDGAFHQLASFLERIFANPIAISLIFSLAVVTVTVLAKYRYKHRKTEIEASLKHEMLQRGMSADEIERVLAAGTDSKSNQAEAISKRTAPYSGAKEN